MIRSRAAIVALTGLSVLSINCASVHPGAKVDAHVALDIRHVESQAQDILDFVEGQSGEMPLEYARVRLYVEEGLDSKIRFAGAKSETTESGVNATLVLENRTDAILPIEIAVMRMDKDGRSISQSAVLEWKGISLAPQQTTPFAFALTEAAPQCILRLRRAGASGGAGARPEKELTPGGSS